MWPTPLAGDYKVGTFSLDSIEKRKDKGKQIFLSIEVLANNYKTWATPTTRDWRGHTGDHKDRGYGQTLCDQLER